MHPLHKILRTIAKAHGLEGSAALNTLRKKWVPVMGQTIAVHTFPETIRNNILTILVDTPQWMHHLSFYKEDMAARLKSYKIDDIRFRVGKIPEDASETVTPEMPEELTDDESQYVENVTSNISDEALRKQFRSLITRGLKKGKLHKKV